MLDLTVIILTFNEEIHIGRAIASVVALAREIVVVDSGSTDRTAEIAESYGARIVRHPFVNYAKQFNWALDNLPLAGDWIMRLDADEVIEPDLAAELARRLPALPSDVTGVSFDRKHIFLGRWIRRGGRYPLTLLRVWRRGRGRVEDRWMDEHVILDGGRTVRLKGGFADHNLNDLTFFTDKHNKYATREAVDIIYQKLGLATLETVRKSTGQASVKRFLKEEIYNKLPFELSALAYFVGRYIFQLGFMDGRPGFAYHFFQGYWYRTLVGAKVHELMAATSHLAGAEEKRAELARLTGLKLVDSAS